MIATAVRLGGPAGALMPWLRRWLAVEADEFAREAIAAALAAIDAAPAPAEALEMPAHFVEAYSYAAERLCHRVRSPLTRSAALLLRLERLSKKVTVPEDRAELTALYADVQSLFQRLGRVLEFDLEGTYVSWQTIALGEWLDAARPVLAPRFGQATITVRGALDARRCGVRVNGFLIDTVFGNLWANAVQAAEEAGADDCLITAELGLDGPWLELLFRDNGPGFSREQVETAFRLPFSTKGETRGRGLLEIAEAVRRLQGSVRLVAHAPDDYRVLIRLPAEKP